MPGGGSQGPPREVPRDGLESRGQGGRSGMNLQEEDDYHFHCRWHPDWSSSMPKFLLQGVMRHLTGGRRH